MKIRPKGNIASIPLYIKILVGMIAGIATGMLFISFGQGEVVQLWIKLGATLGLLTAALNSQHDSVELLGLQLI